MKRTCEPHETSKEKKKKKKQTLTSTSSELELPSSKEPDVDLVEYSTGGSKGRNYTVSLALPGSIISNAQTQELKTYLAGQIARAVCVFNVDEVVIFNEQPPVKGTAQGSFDPNLFLARILQYLETPQYLRRSLFPMHKDLVLVGLLNPLDCPHHMRIDDECKYREGVVLDQPSQSKGQGGSYVNAGLRKDVQVDKRLKPGVRVTVQMKGQPKGGKPVKGTVVSPSLPRTKDAIYWGYTTRHAASLSAVFQECPFEGGYDLTIGTSERGASVDEMKSLKPFRHLLVVFGGLQGLEASLESDESLDVEEVSQLFHLYLNTCLHQGSRTIRTEEAILITMAALRPHIVKSGLV